MDGDILTVMETGRKKSKTNGVGLAPARLREIYRTMALTRALEERGVNLQRQGRIGFYIGGIGQEAVGIGAAAALEKDDWIAPSYRLVGSLLLRGVPMVKLVAQMIGNAGDPSKGRQMPNHYSHKEVHFVSISSPIATQIPQATGVAMAMKHRRTKQIVLCDFGDGATSEGDFHVGINFAAVYGAPIVFLCQNNQYAISCPVDRQTVSESIAIKAKAYGIEGVRVDGNDVLAVHQTVKQAADRARSGGGPTLIEAYTYRLGSHSSSDDASKYRPTDELESWKKKDPVERFRKYLLAQAVVDKAFVDETEAWARDEITRGIEEAEKLGPPPVYTLFEDVFAGLPAHLREQYEELKDYTTRVGQVANTSDNFPL